MRFLFHRYRSGDVARFVDLGVAGEGTVISEQLQRNGMHDWQEGAGMVVQADNVRADLGLGQADNLFGDHVQFPPACAHLLPVGVKLLE